MPLRAGALTACFRLLPAIALVLIAFAHQPLQTVAQPVDFASAYMLPDGTIPAICGLAGGQDGERPGASGCDACRLTGSFAMPGPSATGIADCIGFRPLPVDGDAPMLATRAFVPSAPPTAPPTV